MADTDSVEKVCNACGQHYWLWPDDPRVASKVYVCRSCEGQEGYCEVCRGACGGH